MVKLHTDEEIEKYIQAIKLFNKNIKDLRSFQTVDKVYKNTFAQQFTFYIFYTLSTV